MRKLVLLTKMQDIMTAIKTLDKGEGTIWETYNALTQFATHTPIWEHHDYRRINIMNGAVGLLKKKTDIINYIDIY